MKLAIFNGDRFGVVSGDIVYDITALVEEAYGHLRWKYRMNAVIGDYAAIRDAIGELCKGSGQPLSEVRLCNPLPHPELNLCAIANYRQGSQHERQMPIFILRPADALAGPGASVKLPDMPFGAVHHEAELAVVIGKACANVSADQAMDHVFGYTAAIDLNTRGVLDNLGMVVNSFEGFGSLGPWIVTADEVPDPQSLTVKLWQDDTLRQDFSTADMEYSIAELIAFASQVTTFEPGDVILTGTDHRGVGAVQDGERYRIDIEGIGGFGIGVVDRRARRWPKGADPMANEVLVEARSANAAFSGARAFTPALEG